LQGRVLVSEFLTNIVLVDVVKMMFLQSHSDGLALLK
jgi:hypothetical protein